MDTIQTHTTAVTRSLLVAIMTLSVLSPTLAQSRKQRPFNRIVVLLDRSGSFEAKLPEAREIAWKYIRNIANTSPDDEVYVIGVDQTPSEIAYIKGVRSRREAQAEFKSAFRCVTQGLGTDWVMGLQKTANIFSLPPAPGACHLLVFGDLCVDDVKDSVTCQLIRECTRLDGFDWSSLSNVNGSMWFVAGKARDELLALPAFRALGFQVNSIESSARAKELSAPRRIRSEILETNHGQGLGSLVAWLALLVVVAGIFVVIMRRPANRGNGR